MHRIDHKFMEDLIELEERKEFAGRSVTGSNKLLIVGTFNPSSNWSTKKNDAEWFYGRKQNNLWRYIPEAVIGKSLKNDNKEMWVSFCKQHKIVIIDLIKSFNSIDKLKSFSDIEIEIKLGKKYAQPEYFDSNKSFSESKFKNVIFTRKTWGNDIAILQNAKNELINSLFELKAITSKEQIIYCPAPWGNFKNRAMEWSNINKLIK